MTDFLMNGWYAAGWSHEIGRHLLARRLLDMPVALFRTTSGSAVAMQDRCPHRFAPLSRGRLTDEGVRCGYHGLEFDAAGRCLGSPFNESVPPDRGVRVFPTCERYGVVWFWPGDAARADPGLIPEYVEFGDGPQGYMHVRANYQVIVDNLMDLSHIEFIHGGTFGGGGAFFSGRHTTERSGPQEVWSRWWMPNVDPPPPARAMFGDAKINHWQDMRWNAPSNLMFELGLAPVEVSRDQAPARPGQAHLLTPETATSTHYFYSIGQLPAGRERETEMLRLAFEEEDRPMMEAVQSNMGDDFWSEQPLVLATDSAGIQARRILERLIREEQMQSAPATPT